MIVWVVITKNNHCCCFLFWKNEQSAKQWCSAKYKMSLGNHYPKPCAISHLCYILHVWTEATCRSLRSPHWGWEEDQSEELPHPLGGVQCPRLGLPLYPTAVLLLAGVVRWALAVRACPDRPWGPPSLLASGGHQPSGHPGGVVRPWELRSSCVKHICNTYKHSELLWELAN